MNETKQCKCLFVISIIFLLITYGVVFGLFLLGFKLTQTIDVDNKNNGNALVSTNDGGYISTLQGEVSVNISSIWDNNNTNIGLINIDKIYGVFGGKFFNIKISYFMVNFNPNFIELYDNSGKMKLEYFPDNNNEYILYQTLDNGTIIKYNTSETISSERRRLQLLPASTTNLN